MFIAGVFFTIGLMMLWTGKTTGNNFQLILGIIIGLVSLAIGIYLEQIHKYIHDDYNTTIKDLQHQINMINKVMRWYENDEK